MSHIPSLTQYDGCLDYLARGLIVGFQKSPVMGEINWRLLATQPSTFHIYHDAAVVEAPISSHHQEAEQVFVTGATRLPEMCKCRVHIGVFKNWILSRQP